MKKILILMIFLEAQLSWGKPPEQSEVYKCTAVKKPVFLHQTKDNLVIGVCGSKESETNNFSDLKIQILSSDGKSKKPVFENHSKNRRFLVIEKRDGLLIIEKIKVEKEFVEVFRHEIVCDKNKCKLDKELCISSNRVKQKWIFDHINDSKIKSRMKKLGCKP